MLMPCTYLSAVTFLSLALTDSDLTEIAIVGIHDSVPGDGGGVQLRGLTNLSTAQITRVLLRN